MFIKVDTDEEQQCYKCSYQHKGSMECKVSLCKGGWLGYFTLETVKDTEEHQGAVDTPLDTQVGGSHYKDMAIQPVEFCQKNNLNYCESNIIKYACRHKNKNGVEDVRKIIHYAKLILQLEYGVNG